MPLSGGTKHRLVVALASTLLLAAPCVGWIPNHNNKGVDGFHRRCPGIGRYRKRCGSDGIRDSASRRRSVLPYDCVSSFETTTTTRLSVEPPDRTNYSQSLPSAPGMASKPWGGNHAKDVTIAARLVYDAVQLCIHYQQQQQQQRQHESEDRQAAGNSSAALDKTDGTPVTALDFAIQAYILSSLQKYEGFNCSNVSFVGEEDAKDLRTTHNQGLLQSALALVRILDPNLTQTDFLDALDLTGTPAACGGTKSIPHRSWILDPIDGTRGLLSGNQYAIGLALCLDGEVVVGLLGNPSVPNPVMVACRGHGLRYYHRNDNDNDDDVFLDVPRTITGSWYTRVYDLDNLEAVSTVDRSKQACVDYPPYLLSMGPKTSTSGAHNAPPRPFGPLCSPTDLCCGSLVKYYAIASGRASGFVQLASSGLVNSWDHAPGMLCVLESGGRVVVVTKEEEEDSFEDVPSLPLFDQPQFKSHRGIVCVAREASSAIFRRLVESVTANDRTSS